MKELTGDSVTACGNESQESNRERGMGVGDKVKPRTVLRWGDQANPGKMVSSNQSQMKRNTPRNKVELTKTLCKQKSDSDFRRIKC